jgi:hypothetical protein
MEKSAYRGIKTALRQLYLDDPRPWLVGFSGGKAESDETPSSATLRLQENTWKTQPLTKSASS